MDTMKVGAEVPPVLLRTHRPGDAELLVDLVNKAMPADAMTTETFAENVFLDSNFDPEGLVVAELDGQPVGFAHAVRQRSTVGIPVPAEGGWITLFAVDPAHRRRGIGSAVLTAAVDFLRRHGSQWAVVSGYPPAYFLPGVDPDLYPEAVSCLERNGFSTASRPVAMDAPLHSYATPDEVLELIATRESEGYTFADAGPDDMAELIQHASTDLAPDWGEALRASAIRHRRLDRTRIARDPRGAIVGFATYGAYSGVPDRFGPFGVLGDQRGTGLGRILLHQTMTKMRAEGAHVAWFLWTGENSPAGNLYRSAGFVTTRRFQVMKLTFQGEQ